MMYEGLSLRLSNRQYTLLRRMSRDGIPGSLVSHYDMRTFIPLLKAELITGTLKDGFVLTLSGHERLMAFGNSNIERGNFALKIPEFVMNYRIPKTVRMIDAA